MIRIKSTIYKRGALEPRASMVLPCTCCINSHKHSHVELDEILEDVCIHNYNLRLSCISCTNSKILDLCIHL